MGRKIVRRLLAGLIVVVCVVLAGLLLMWGLRHVAIGQIVELTGARVEAEAVDVNFDGSVSIDKLTVKPYQANGPNDIILRADRVYARFGIGSLLLLRPRLKQISVRGFVFDARNDLDKGRWNIAALKIRPPIREPAKVPTISLEKGMLRYSKVSDGQVRIVAEIPVDANLGPAAEPHEGYGFRITTAQIRGGYGKNSLTGFWKPGRLTFSGGISSADIAAFERVWMIYILAGELNYDENGEYSLRLVVRDLQNKHRPEGDVPFSAPPEFIKKFRTLTALQAFFDRYDPQGHVDVDLEASGNLKHIGDSSFSGKLYCRGVSIRDRKFPYHVENIAGEMDFTEKSVALNGLQGEHGNVKLTFNGKSEAFGSRWVHEIRITSDSMVLDEDLYSALNKAQKELWSAFSPSGMVAIDYRTARKSDGHKERTLAVELLGADAVYRSFPYPLKNLTGRLIFAGGAVIFSDVVSEYEGRRIGLNGSLEGIATGKPEYEFEIRVKGIALDSVFGSALSDRQRAFWERLDLSGMADADVNLSRGKPGADAGSTGMAANVLLKKGSLKVGRLPQPFSDVSGRIAVRPEIVEIEQLTGRYGQGTVSLAGRIRLPDEARRSYYALSLRAEQLEVDGDLVGALPETAKEVVSRLQPGGAINLNLELKSDGPGDQPVDYKVVVDCVGGTAGTHLPASSANDVVIDFEKFSYPLKDIRGRITITRDGIDLEGITAVAGDEGIEQTASSRVGIDGRIALADGAFSSASLRLGAGNAFFDSRLASAFPEGLRSLYLWLSPAGEFDLDLDRMEISGSGDGGRTVDFSSRVKFKGCNLRARPVITGFNGTLKTRGMYKTRGKSYDGRVSLTADSMKIKGVSVTGLRAEMYYDRARERWVTTQLFGDCYGGRLTGKIELEQTGAAISGYQLWIGFDNVDVGELLKDQIAQEETGSVSEGEAGKLPRDNGHTSGKMGGSLSVVGSRERGRDTYSRKGTCKLTIRDMRAGKASPLEKLFLALSLAEPHDFVFERMLVDSHINQDRILLKNVDLSGEAAAYTGEGWIDLVDESIDLVLYARGSRLATGEPSVIGSLTEGLGSAVVRINVSGNLYDPDVKKTALPVLKDTLDIFGPKPPAPGR
ncbi:MAG: hypothetical protein ACYTBJ_09160 [Planctomycetota bacterium]|jgi:hypothetical protein